MHIHKTCVSHTDLKLRTFCTPTFCPKVKNYRMESFSWVFLFVGVFVFSFQLSIRFFLSFEPEYCIQQKNNFVSNLSDLAPPVRKVSSDVKWTCQSSNAIDDSIVSNSYLLLLFFFMWFLFI